MFFPRIVRRHDYDRREDDQYYADYARYRDAIMEDCQFRCVYCDVALAECGLEGFHLDHFRPQHVFPDMRNSPFNLVLACPACNTAKSKDWPEDEQGSACYIDPFEHDRREFFQVNDGGEIVALREEAEYSVVALKLNRLTRVHLRRRRLLNQREQELFDRINEKIRPAMSEEEAVLIRYALSELR